MDLRVIRADGATQSSQATLRANEQSCRAFFSGDGNVLAVSTGTGLRDVGVRFWDLSAARWQSRFGLGPQLGLEGELGVEGFWSGSRDLLVVGRKGKRVDAALVASSGRVVAGPKELASPSLIDAKHNRAWAGQSGRLWGCSVRAVPLIGEGVPGPSTRLPPTQAGDCTTDFFGFPDAGTIVGAAGKGNGGTWVWTVDLKAGGSTKVLVPSPAKRFLDAWVDSGPAGLAASPVGEFFAVDVQVTRWSHFDTQRAEWSELHLFQIAPFREIAKIGPKKKCGDLLGFAIGDADDKAHIAMNWCGKWSVETVNRATADSQR